MRAVFSIVPIIGGLVFFIGAYSFYRSAPGIGTAFYWASGVFAVCGSAFLAWGLAAVFRKRDESVSKKNGIVLKQTGNRITAAIFHLEQVTSVRINNRSPYVIHARGRNSETLKEQTFKSRWIFSDLFIELRDHKEVAVYVDRADPSRYYMDLESIGIA